MLGIGAIAIAVWFYFSLKNAGKDNLWIWVAAGVGVYYLSSAIWIHVVMKSIMGKAFLTHKISIQLGIKFSGLIAGILACVLFRWKFILPKGAAN